MTLSAQTLNSVETQRTRWGCQRSDVAHSIIDLTGFMKKPLLVIATVALMPEVCNCDGIRDKVAKGEPQKESRVLVDPNDTLLGFPIGTTEDELVVKLGEPGAYVRLDQSNTAAIYENTYAYIFNEGKLEGIRISSTLIDHVLSSEFSEKRFYVQQRWQLDNGIKPEMSLPAVREILGKRMKSATDYDSKHRQYYEDGDSVVYLFFSHWVDRGEADTAYSVNGILVKKKD
jgi:hypothetical protein